MATFLYSSGLVLPPSSPSRNRLDDDDRALPVLKDVMDNVEDLRCMIAKGYDTDEGISELVDYAVNQRPLFIPSLHDAPLALARHYVYATLLTDLILYSMTAIVDDVPEDILPEYMWAQRGFIKLFEETTSEMRLRYCMDFKGGVLDTPEMSFAVVHMSKINLCQCLMRPGINQITEALSLLEDTIHKFKDSVLFLDGTRDAHKPWLYDPLLYTLYAEACMLSNKLNADTKTVMEHALESLLKKKRAIRDVDLHIILVRAGLAKVLSVLDIEPETRKVHTDWAASTLRKNPRFKSRVIRYLRDTDQPIHPVAAALGEEWFEEREPTAPSSLTSRSYRALVTSKNTLEARRAEGSISDKGIKEIANAVKWITIPHYANSEAIMHAMSLPLDLTRSDTHCVLRVVKADTTRAARESQDIRDKFYVSKWGVFKIQDVRSDIMFCEKFKSLEETDRSIDALIHPCEAAVVGTKVLVLTWIVLQDRDTEAALRMDAFCLGEDFIRRTPYDPAWRKNVNRKRSAPELLVPPCGAPDRELDYDDSRQALVPRSRRPRSDRQWRVPRMDARTMDMKIRRMLA
ncbi:hypothetical protein EIP91_004136 [Steccherinum ochraceum]|uniref:Uncharacterized protein n=1 Tax=Steccherinum ochraceum TaxID=92696 RepID=A0A4R0RHS8_9APHY|nr:hypothetical protein EIP91_004136 [Steccherinum ochraceum]